VLPAGGKLVAGASLRSPSGAFRLVMQNDGNLVEYTRENRVVWASMTFGGPGSFTAMQSDGNLVIYSASGQVQRGGHGIPTMTFRAGSYLRLQDDANLVVYAPNAQPMWATYVLLNSEPAPAQPPASPSRGNLTNYETHWWGIRIWLNHTTTQAAWQSVKASGSFAGLGSVPGVPGPAKLAFKDISCVSQFINDVGASDVGYGVVMDINWWAPFWSCGTLKVWSQ
jgi:hypothetical protein